MRKFYVSWIKGDYQGHDEVILQEGQKANRKTFLEYFEHNPADFNNHTLFGDPEIMGWSLIEE